MQSSLVLLLNTLLTQLHFNDAWKNWTRLHPCLRQSFTERWMELTEKSSEAMMIEKCSLDVSMRQLSVVFLDFRTLYHENTGLSLFPTIFSRMEMKVTENHYIAV